MSTVDLRAARRARGISQRRLAELIGVAQNTVSNWELGRARVPPDRRGALAFRLGVAVDAIPDRLPVAPPYPPRGEPARCGTYAGSVRHTRMREECCGPCAKARNAYADAHRVRTPRPPAECGTNRGYHSHRYRGEDACVACKVAHADYTRERYASR